MRRAAAGGTLAVAVLLAGCAAGEVEVPAPAPQGRAADLCRTLVDQAPDTLFGQERVAVRPDSEFVAAWGSPTIALRCGVPRPEGLRADSELTVVNEIAWLPQPADRPNLYTAVGREAYVEMSIPPSYTPPAEALVAVGDLIAREVPALPAGEL
ncbi:DUF3515 domain-containing protein [Marinitenerispora sediminis]|uniref:DUF3515 domain-containing protein n=1 Tax=Marinitenerispora sediminis TaxID=1931232 RepID=A0A368TBB7_9ACTN|nr:DUF3515 domain-containing protein [Marinitenerispora sediminis]RCV54036.1 DUF3515 domain-containing protein [Marinitenerispora sediminis]RCV60835.1 DUF3515 domain-containing protein [Marinitenerispora sediminis]RCV62444.1 DUF3515 domain-containing protein [Marinitenerispora sediminis]